MIVFGLLAVMAAIPAEVIECYDGDTCTMRLELGLGVSKVERVRLCNIDAPEMRGEREFALNAKHGLQKLLFEAEQLSVLVSGSIYKPRRSFNRLLAWVLVDGMDVGKILLEQKLVRLADKTCRSNTDE